MNWRSSLPHTPHNQGSPGLTSRGAFLVDCFAAARTKKFEDIVAFGVKKFEDIVVGGGQKLEDIDIFLRVLHPAPARRCVIYICAFCLKSWHFACVQPRLSAFFRPFPW